MNTLDFVDQASLRDDIPAFNPGDTVNVHVKVIEGAKERIQVFKGVVLRRQGGGVRETFTLQGSDFGKWYCLRAYSSWGHPIRTRTHQKMRNHREERGCLRRFRYRSLPLRKANSRR